MNIGLPFLGKLGLSFHIEIRGFESESQFSKNHSFQILKSTDFGFQKLQFLLWLHKVYHVKSSEYQILSTRHGTQAHFINAAFSCCSGGTFIGRYELLQLVTPEVL